MFGPLFFTFVILMCGALLLWLLSMRANDVSIVDIGWGIGFVIVTWVALAHSYPSPRHWLLASLVTLWGVRLSAHIYARHAGEDIRYQRMRAKHGEAFRYTSGYLVFGLQAVLCWVISLPIQIAELMDEHWQRELGTLDSIGIVVFAFGFLFEVVADTHLMLWKRNAANIGKVLDTGLWSLSRHPNYFGECVLWWGLYLIAAASGWGALAIWSPILVTYLLLKVSGVPMLDKELLQRKPAYAAYVARTSAFFPRPPKGDAGAGPAGDSLDLDPEEEIDTAEHHRPSAPKTAGAAYGPAAARRADGSPLREAPKRVDPPTIEITIPPPAGDDTGGFER